MKKVILISLCMIALVAFAMWAPDADAYMRYNDGCQTCHGAFSDDISPQGSIFPGNGGKHGMHRDVQNMDTECDLCHSSGDNKNPFLNVSDGTPDVGEPGVGCSGCHEQNGLRLHHLNNSVNACLTCHTNDTPPPAEGTMPPYYGTVDTLANMPCNDVAQEGINENWTVGDTLGLDNDGDNAYDMADTDCSGPSGPGPELSIPDLAADANQSVTLPVTYTANANDIAAVVFSVDFDENNLIFDDTNTTGLPFPDSITINPSINPFIFTIGVTYDANDTDGELDFTFADFTEPFTALPELDLATITFTAGPNTAVAPVNFSQSPVASFGNTAGESVAGTTVDGSVSITSESPCGDGIVDVGEDCDDGAANGSTVCGCQTDCTYTASGTSCDDGQFCNGTDTCDGNGACQVGTPVVCDDGVGCTDDSCDETNDVCVYTANDGNCDNGQFCDGTETCDQINDCQAGTAPSVDDGVACTDDSCDEATDSIVNTPNDANCDNGQFCDGSETCDPVNDCQAGTPPVVDDGVGCTDDSCDEANDVIVNAPNDGNCDDGQFCDGSETCDPVNDCQAGTPVNVDDGVACTDDSCDEANDVIVNSPNDGFCDNGQFCDGTETCDPVNDCQAGTPPSIDDGVACTDDSCDEATDTIVNTPNDGLCDNGQFCDGSETCDPVNDCQEGTPPSVNDGVACTDDSCDEVNDVIVNTPNDGNCDNGQFCDGSETCDPVNDCQAGTPPVVDDGVGCTDDFCDEASDIIVNTPNDGNCDNGQFCDGSETCDPVNDCQAGTPPVVDDGVGCTDDSCDEANDTIVNAPNDGNCDNGQFCDGSETCDPVNDCQAGTPPSVDDGVACTDDSCDEVNDTIVNTANDGNCDNGQFCDGSETCDPVNDCQAGTAPSVDDGVGCTDDICDEASDTIVNTPNDANCDNGQFCDGSETCDPNLDCQVGTPPITDDGVGCTDDSCDEVNDTIVNTPNDGLCDNGQFCDGAETCDPVNDCQAGTPPCDPATETCDDVNDICVPLPTGCAAQSNPDQWCNDQDGNYCNGTETCNLGTGICQSGTPVDCNDGVSCTIDSCNEGTDSCDNLPNDGLCDNGQFCDGAETCDPVNNCQAGTPPVVDDGVGCTDDSCDEVNDTIVNAPNNANCDNGQFCDGSETCDPVNDCQAGTDPCLPGETCNEADDICIVECQGSISINTGQTLSGNPIDLTSIVTTNSAVNLLYTVTDGGSTTLFIGDEMQAQSVDTTGWTDGVKNLTVDGDDATCGTPLTASGTFTFDGQQMAETDCFDGMDDDGDGLTDCADPDCDGVTGGACATGNACTTGTRTCVGGSGGSDTKILYVMPSSGVNIASGIQTDHGSCSNDPSSAYVEELSTNLTDMCTSNYRYSQSSVGLHSEHYFNTAYASNTTVTGDSYQFTIRDGGTFGIQLFYVTSDGSKTYLGTEVTRSNPDGASNNYTVDLSGQSGMVPAGAKLGLRTRLVSLSGSDARVYLGNPDGRTGNISGKLIVNESGQGSGGQEVCVEANAPDGTACDDGQFCTVSETCNGSGVCSGGSSPCQPWETCNEADDICIAECQGSISINTGQTLSGNPIDLTSIVTTNDAANLIYTVTEQGSGSCDVNPNGTYIEAENFTGTINQGSATFSVEAVQSGYSGSGYLLSNGGSTGSCPPVNEGKEYQVNFPTAGTYTVWMRGYAIGSSDNSVFIGLDGNCVGALTETLYNAWTWTKDIQNGSNTITVSTAGIHTINVWVREPDHKVDGIYLDMAGNTPTDGSHGDEIDPNNCGGGSTTLFIGDEMQAQSVDTTGWTDGVKNLTVDGDDATCGTPLTASGTFTFEGAQCIIDDDCDDGVFCNGSETCDANGNCQAGTPPSVDDGVACTDDSCDEASDTIVNLPNDGLCDNGQFCDGSETCDPVNDCQAGVNPCTNGNCNEIIDVCGCTTDADCDDGLFCNGTEICDVNGACLPGIEPCFAGDVCDDNQDICIPLTVDLDIRGFRIDSSIRVGESLQRIQLTIENANGPSQQGALATLTGIQEGKQVYYEERTVWDISKNGKARFAFPSYTPIKAGDINWTVEILDSDPDIDIETATTRVRSSGDECATDADCDDGLFCNGTETCKNGNCSSGQGNPCQGNDVCDEVNDVCE